MGGFRITPEAGRVAVAEAAGRPFGEACEHLRHEHRVNLSKHRLEQLTQEVGHYWLEQDQRVYEQLATCATHPDGLPLGVDDPPDQCVVFADGVMAHSDGAWHEARVGVVRTVRGDKIEKRHVARLSDPRDFGHHLWRAAAMMGCHRAGTLAFVGDGSHWLWRLCDRHFEGGSEQAKRWATRTLGMLRAGAVDEALSQVESLSADDDIKRQAKHELVTYLTNHRRQMDYPRYERLGLPIGSGEVESACKTLVQKRCKQSGMRWSGPGLETLLRVRCELSDGSFKHSFGNWPQNCTAWRQRKKAA